MYAKFYSIKNSTDKQVYILQSNGFKRKPIIIEKHPSYNALLEQIKPLTLKEYIDTIAKKIKDETPTPIFRTIYFDGTTDKYYKNETKNAGYLFLERAYYDLGIESFINSYKFNNNLKVKYSLNDALRLITYSRVIEPCSKFRTSKKINDYVEDFDLSDDDLYDFLDKIDDFQNDLSKKIAKKFINQFGSDESIYYDCTNFYFESQYADDEDGLRDYGVEKNHRPDPIVGYGLLTSGKGYPISSITYRGNKSEKPTLKDAILDTDEEASRAKIIVADCGLNTSNNKDFLNQTDRKYIFCQSILQLSKEAQEEVIKDDGYVIYYEDSQKRKMKKVKSIFIKRSNGKYERIVCKFDTDSYLFTMKTLEKRIEKANHFIKNPAKLNKSQATDGKQYITKIVYDKKTGEIIESDSILTLNEEMIEKEKKFAGYICYSTNIFSKDKTSEMLVKEYVENGYTYIEKSDLEIIKIAGKRVEIEDFFRIMKTNMKARPIFVRKPAHIKAHLFTVYLAICLMSHLKLKYNIKGTNEEFFTSLRNLTFIKHSALKEEYYDVANRNELLDDLAKQMNIDKFNYPNFETTMIKKMINQFKNR